MLGIKHKSHILIFRVLAGWVCSPSTLETAAGGFRVPNYMEIPSQKINAEFDKALSVHKRGGCLCAGWGVHFTPWPQIHSNCFCELRLPEKLLHLKHSLALSGLFPFSCPPQQNCVLVCLLVRSCDTEAVPSSPALAVTIE